MSDVRNPTETSPYRVALIGAGVVGRAIAEAHLRRGIAVELVDNDPETLATARRVLEGRILNGESVTVSPMPPLEIGGERWMLVPGNSAATMSPAAGKGGGIDLLVIESIVERRDAKRQLIDQLSRHFGASAVIATNTSSLRLSDLESASEHPERLCGMHFFMPVVGRDLVEIVRTPRTNAETTALAAQHAARLGKQTLTVGDSPGFVVNRMLSPYLNQSMLMLGAGADHNRMRSAALRFGMPMSPLELVDLIGTRTAFDAGRAAWQAFPGRIDPAPVLPGMIKAGLGGRAAGAGFYQYDFSRAQILDAARLNPSAVEVISRYQRAPRQWTDTEMLCQLCVPMLVEAGHILRERIVATTDDIELAMDGGLGFRPQNGFFRTFDEIGIATIIGTMEAAGARDKALNAPKELLASLAQCDRTADAVTLYARQGS